MRTAHLVALLVSIGAAVTMGAAGDGSAGLTHGTTDGLTASGRLIIRDGPYRGIPPTTFRATGGENRALSAYVGLPLSFVPNAGQTDRQVRYSAQTGGANFYFTKNEAVSLLMRKNKGLVLRLGFLGANANVAIAGRGRARGKVNYLRGSDPKRWRTNLSTYREVVYRDLWSGIDLVFRGAKGKLKYELVLEPGARVRDIGLVYRGARRVSVDRSGNLRVHTALGALTDTRPFAYQLIRGKRVPVSSRFALGRSNRFGFAIGDYDRARPLVIDPGLVYSTYLGGTLDDVGWSVAVDPQGRAFVSGVTESPDFPTTAGAFEPTYNGGVLPFGGDTFVTKLNASGTDLIYSTYLGGTADEPYWGSSIAVDQHGRAYVAGTTWSPDFPTTPGAFDTSFNGGYDAFVTKLNATGSALVYSTFLGGSGFEGPYLVSALALDHQGRVYLTGFTDSPDFPTTPGAYDTAFGGFYDAFVTKLNASGSDLVYSTFLGDVSDDDGTSIAIDPQGSAYVTGYTASPTFPTTAGAFQTTHNGAYDGFVTKLNDTGSAIVYSTFLGGTATEAAAGIDVQPNRTAYVTGWTDSADYPTTPGSHDPVYNGGVSGDTFVTKLDDSGGDAVYSTYLGGTLDDLPYSIVVDPAGQAHVTGFTNSPDFDTTADAHQPTNDGSYDAYVTKLNRTGSGLVYSTYLGGTIDDYGSGIALDPSKAIYVTGSSTSPNFDTTTGAHDTVYGGGTYGGDAFVTKIDAKHGDCPEATDSDADSLLDASELLFLTLVGASDSDFDGIKDGNDDANANGRQDEDEDDDDGCPGGDGEDDDDGEESRTYINDFERFGDDTPARGWYDVPPGTIHRTPSGYVSPSGYASGIQSAHGKFHARLRTAGCEAARFVTNCFGPFTDWGKGSQTNPVFPEDGYITWVDVYLDVPWVATGGGKVDYRFDWSSAINNTTGTHQRDFVFNVGTPLNPLEASTAPGFYVNASTNALRANAFPQNPCPAPFTPPNSCRTPVKITQSGWYTFFHHFHPQTFMGTDYLAVDMKVLRHDAVVASWTISMVPLDNMAIIGGDAYGWFAINEISDLAIDCSVLGPPELQHPPLGARCTHLESDNEGEGHERDYDDERMKSMRDRRWDDD